MKVHEHVGLDVTYYIWQGIETSGRGLPNSIHGEGAGVKKRDFISEVYKTYGMYRICTQQTFESYHS